METRTGTPRVPGLRTNGNEKEIINEWKKKKKIRLEETTGRFLAREEK